MLIYNVLSSELYSIFKMKLKNEKKSLHSIGVSSVLFQVFLTYYALRFKMKRICFFTAFLSLFVILEGLGLEV